jgi:hypothetical protein
LAVAKRVRPWRWTWHTLAGGLTLRLTCEAARRSASRHADYRFPAELEAVGFQRRKAPASMNGCVTGTHPPKLSDGGNRAIDLADNVSDTFRPHLGAVLAIPRNFAMAARPERC